MEEFCTNLVSIATPVLDVLVELDSVFHPPGGVGTAHAGTDVGGMNCAALGPVCGGPVDHATGPPILGGGAGGTPAGRGAKGPLG